MINVAEILKDCPQGMGLDCTVYEDCTFLDVDTNSNSCLIRIVTPCGIKYLDKYGRFAANDKAKCIIFPKGKTTWEGFQRPFKDGDVVFYNDTIAIFKEWGDETLFRTYVVKYLCRDSFIDIKVPLFGKSVRKEIRFATEEEKQKLFQAIKDNGYKWNSETKTLEKLPKFKAWNTIRNKNDKTIHTINYVYRDSYGLCDGHILSFKDQDNYELVPNKFDITTLKEFESRVLVRDYDNRMWIPTFWGKYLGNDSNCSYLTTNGCYKYCIPYEGNEHLSGTTNDCDEYYKTW